MMAHETVTKEDICNIMILGGPKVGKTQFAIQMVAENFLDEFDETIEDSYRKMIAIDETIDGVKQQIHIILDMLDKRIEWDNVNIDTKYKNVDSNSNSIDINDTIFDDIFKRQINDCDAFLLMYSITSLESFNQMKFIYHQIINIRKLNDENNVNNVKQTPMVIVGNKCDKENEREVLESSGLQFAEMNGNYKIPFFEISLKDKLHYYECIHELAREYRRLKRESKNTNDSRNSNEQNSNCARCFIL